MTPQEFKAKFPERKEDINTNCLEDIACPKCGNRGDFKILVSAFATVCDDGIDGTEDTEWDEQSHIMCKDCMHEGIVKDFTIKGLDDFLIEMEDV
jgi:DNA-directed RNA polymerase subunit RPC12/RpoP